MTGYQEIFTDPSYYGQIMVATNAHSIYGVNENEVSQMG
jgi:carbamoyl-phosphate synthase small subunit